MSGSAASLPCPICSHTGVFYSVESLRDRLIDISTNKLHCPVCQDEFLGLDKLTIHLFSHVKTLVTKSFFEKVKSIENQNISKSEKLGSQNIIQHKKSKAVITKNRTTSTLVNSSVKFVKIYPKLPVISLNPVPLIDISKSSIDEGGVQTGDAMFIKTETTISPLNTICNICGLQFVNENILKMHRSLIHNIDEKCDQNFTKYQCHLCPKNFKMRGSLMVHLRVAHYGLLSEKSDLANSTAENKKSLDTDELPNDKSINVERSDGKHWQCDICRKCFTTKYFLKKHKRLHTGEMPYACVQCNKTFTFQQSYHKHLLYHNDEKPYTCSFCGRAFKELSTLHNHQRIHTGEKPFSCETCGKCFRQRVSYLVHRRIHTGVMPYKCTACEKSFRYKVSQRTHKCQAQPPGTVIRQAGNLVEKLKKKHVNSTQIPSSPHNETSLNILKYHEISEANAELVRSGAKLSLEDMESENFTLIAENFTDTHMENTNDIVTENILDEIAMNAASNFRDSTNSNIDEIIDAIQVIDKNIPSPSDILKNLCLSKDEDFTELLTLQTEERSLRVTRNLDDLL